MNIRHACKRKRWPAVQVLPKIQPKVYFRQLQVGIGNRKGRCRMRRFAECRMRVESAKGPCLRAFARQRAGLGLCPCQLHGAGPMHPRSYSRPAINTSSRTRWSIWEPTAKAHVPVVASPAHLPHNHWCVWDKRRPGPRPRKVQDRPATNMSMPLQHPHAARVEGQRWKANGFGIGLIKPWFAS